MVPITIKEFLSVIDPMGSMNHDQVQQDIALVVLMKAIEKAKSRVRAETQAELTRCLKQMKIFNADRIFGIFTEHKEQTVLLQAIIECTPEVQADYMRTQVHALSAERKAALVQKFPELQLIML